MEKLNDWELPCPGPLHSKQEAPLLEGEEKAAIEMLKRLMSVSSRAGW